MNYVSTYVAVMLLYASFGVAGLVASSQGFARPSLVQHLALVAFGILVAVPIHEAGHRLAGASQGYRCLRFVLGPLELAPVDGRWRIRLIPFRHAGVVYQVPSSFTHFRLKKAICLAAGPGLSLIASLVFSRVALHSTSSFSFWLWMVNAQMCLLGVLELVPLRFGVVESDGLQLWKMARGGAPVDAIARDLLADSVNYTPLRPRDWPADLIERMAGMPAEAHQRRYGLYMAYIHCLDAGDLPAGIWSNFWNRGRRRMVPTTLWKPHISWHSTVKTWMARGRGWPVRRDFRATRFACGLKRRWNGPRVTNSRLCI
jgi:hypothetical protein